MTRLDDDFHLLERWREHDDKAALNALVDRNFRCLYRFFINKAREVDVEDLIQKTMLQCLESLENFRHDASFRTFLLGVARHTLLHHYRRFARKEGKLDPLTGPTAEFVGAAGITSALARRREQELILAALRAITIDHQVVLELHFWEGLTAKECAHVLDVEVSTIKGRLHRAKLALKAALERGDGNPEEKRSITSAMASWILGIHDHIRKGSTEEALAFAGWDTSDLEST